MDIDFCLFQFLPLLKSLYICEVRTYLLIQSSTKFLDLVLVDLNLAFELIHLFLRQWLDTRTMILNLFHRPIQNSFELPIP